MSNRPWHKRYHADFLNGVKLLGPAERGVYATLLDMMYDRGGPIPMDASGLARINQCSTKMFNVILEKLIADGKIVLQDGFLTNPRAIRQMGEEAVEHQKLRENALKTPRNRAEIAAKTERKSPEKEVGASDISALAENRLEPNTQHARASTRYQSLERELDPSVVPLPRDRIAPLAARPPSQRLPTVAETEPPRPVDASAAAIVEAFDTALLDAFGVALGTRVPATADRVHAARWVDAGAKLGLDPSEVLRVCVGVFAAVQGRKAAASETAVYQLSYFTAPITDALRLRAKPIEEGSSNVSTGARSGSTRSPIDDGTIGRRAVWNAAVRHYGEDAVRGHADWLPTEDRASD